jgi:Phage integrase, N-terminal SAM-like domain
MRTSSRINPRAPLARYSGRTIDACRHDPRGYFQWAADNQVPVLEATRIHIELYRSWMDQRGLAASTSDRRLSTVCGFSRFAHIDGLHRVEPSRSVADRQLRAGGPRTGAGARRPRPGAAMTNQSAVRSRRVRRGGRDGEGSGGRRPTASGLGRGAFVRVARRLPGPPDRARHSPRRNSTPPMANNTAAPRTSTSVGTSDIARIIAPTPLPNVSAPAMSAFWQVPAASLI